MLTTTFGLQWIVMELYLWQRTVSTSIANCYIIIQFDEKDYLGPDFPPILPNCVPLYSITSNSGTYGQKCE